MVADIFGRAGDAELLAVGVLLDFSYGVDRAHEAGHQLSGFVTPVAV